METYYQEFVSNLVTATLETITLEDRETWIVPGVGITEGVHNGNKGRILYLTEDGEKDPSAWDHKPAVINHPTINERPVTATTPEVINNQKVGYPLGTTWDDAKLKMKFYVDKERLKDRSEKIYNALMKGEKVEVSTGLLVDIEKTKGIWQGQEYDGIARNWRPDHVAFLPEDVGACSIEKGAGLLANKEGDLVTNEMSLSDIQYAVSCAIRDRFDAPGYMWTGWVSDVFEGYAIYYNGGDYYQQNYSIKDGTVTLTGDPVKVVRETVYRSVTNKQWVGNASGQHYTLEEFAKMGKKELIDAILLANKESMGEEDRTWLDKKNEKALQSMLDKFTAKKEPTPEPTPEPTVNKLVINKTEKKPAKNLREAIDEFGKDHPMLTPLLNQLADQNEEEEDRLVKVIMANKNNRFAEEYLREKDKEELQAMVDLMGEPEETEVVTNQTPRKGARFIANSGRKPAVVESANDVTLDVEDADFGD